MNLHAVDWIVIALYFVVTLAIGLYYSRRARGDVNEFFLSGRNAPWWLAGTSMVATTFAADTPLAVTELVAKNGIAGNWLWWSLVMSGTMTVFFFARLWRRADVMTDVEFAELRYSGKPAAFLRGFRALYLGIPINCIILAWVNLAMITILKETIGVTQLQAEIILVGLLLFTAFYTTLAGLWGVLVTDLFQFVLMMAMIIVLAIFAVHSVGGVDELVRKVAERDAASGVLGSRLDFLPGLNSAWMPLIALCTYLAVNWWASWYPGSEPGGGGYVAQRIFSAKDERHGVLATLWFNVANFALRPWPWILTALATIVLYPDLKDPKIGYIRIFMDEQVFPWYLRGFIIAGFAAAYMSTIATQLNWGASYIINDFYRRFLVRTASDRHYVLASQAATILLVAVSIVATRYFDSISGAWKLMMLTGAGTGTVYLLRWYWWRINAWSEVVAMTVAAVVSIGLQLPWGSWSGWNSDDPTQFAYLMLTTVAATSVAWIAATIVTPAEPLDKLTAFYRRARPAGPGWLPVRNLLGAAAPEPTETLGSQFVNWLLGSALVYASLFGIGHLVFKNWLPGAGLLILALICGAIISRNLNFQNTAEE
ncbi:sodium:solute symporter family protein [Lacipirellula limnantheis]|uniref:Sodium/glucose cotransporter n=1 Tax=Lacipirellula limnantheis TaxID=2528024 RepID=A0A517TVB7_9BACT|nr:sodium:solute symporter family protein [Lacipirellula limnantheis]QDT72322.1 Sodium/glucose cotransporter [Lacipirellula limnantheis]